MVLRVLLFSSKSFHYRTIFRSCLVSPVTQSCSVRAFQHRLPRPYQHGHCQRATWLRVRESFNTTLPRNPGWRVGHFFLHLSLAVPLQPFTHSVPSRVTVRSLPGTKGGGGRPSLTGLTTTTQQEMHSTGVGVWLTRGKK